MASITPKTHVFDQGLYGYSDYRRTMPQVLALARALELEAAALRERNVMMRERLNVVVEQLVTARRSERERCAKVCDEIFTEQLNRVVGDQWKGPPDVAADCAEIIRALPDEQEPT